MTLHRQPCKDVAACCENNAIKGLSMVVGKRLVPFFLGFFFCMKFITLPPLSRRSAMEYSFRSPSGLYSPFAVDIGSANVTPSARQCAGDIMLVKDNGSNLYLPSAGVVCVCVCHTNCLPQLQRLDWYLLVLTSQEFIFRVSVSRSKSDLT